MFFLWSYICCRYSLEVPWCFCGATYVVGTHKKCLGVFCGATYVVGTHKKCLGVFCGATYVIGTH